MITLDHEREPGRQEEVCPEYNLETLERLLEALRMEIADTEKTIHTNTLADIRARSTLRALRSRRDELETLLTRLKGK